MDGLLWGRSDYFFFALAAGFAAAVVFGAFFGAVVDLRAPDSFLVVRTFTGDLPLTIRASFSTRWLRRRPVLRALVRFFGLPNVFSFVISGV